MGNKIKNGLEDVDKTERARINATTHYLSINLCHCNNLCVCLAAVRRPHTASLSHLPVTACLTGFF